MITPSRWFNDPAFSVLDRMLSRYPGAYSDGEEQGAGNYCPVNVSQDKDHYYIQALVPGIPAEKLEINWQGSSLTISGQLELRLPENAAVVWNEIRPYQFRRVVQLGDAIDVDHVDARLENGVLTISAPKAEEARARSIKVLSGTQESKQVAAR